MKVFISSTYKDLIDYRNAAIRAVEGTNYQASKMEVFGARPEEPLEACLNEVKESDLFIGIYALRYGFIPKSSDISITEMEYAHAKLLGKPIYGFLLDDEKQPWLNKWIEDDPGRTKLKEFKQLLQRDHVCDYFTNPDDLRAKVANALSHYVATTLLNTDFRLPIREFHPTPISTLPPQHHFFGREKELSDISEALDPNTRAWGALIYGPGGIGKTALAIRAADLSQPSLFERKIFITAKVRELDPDGEKKLKEFTRDSYISILNELALELNESNIPRLAPEERANALRLALSGKKTLIIFDNLETLNNDDRAKIYQFLNRLPQGNKAIVTSRRRDDADARIIQLDQLQEVEAEELISELVQSNTRLNSISDTDKKELFYSATGNPLIIRWLIGQVGREGSNIKTITEAIKFMRHAPLNNDPLEYVFGDLLNSLIPKEKMVLAAMTFLNNSPKVEWISKISDHSEATVKLVWEELVNRSILVTNKDSDGYFLPFITKQFLVNKLQQEINKAEKKLAEYAFKIVMEFGGRKNFREQINLAENWPVISSSLPYFVKHDSNDLQILCDALDMFLSSNSLWDEWLWLNQQSELVALIYDDFDSAAERAYKTGLIYSFLGEPDNVLDYANRAEKYWKETKDQKLLLKGKTRVNFLRGIGYKLNGSYLDATEAITSVLTSWGKNNTESIEFAEALNTLAEIQTNQGEITNSIEMYLNAEKNFEEAIRIVKKHNQKEKIAVYMGNFANLYLLRGNNWLRVEMLANDALKLAEELGQYDEIARENYHLAVAYINLGINDYRGFSASQKAVEIYRRLQHKELPKAINILDEWNKKMGSQRKL